MLSNKIKIAYFISYLPKEGPVQVIYDIIQNIDYSKFEVLIITLKKEEKNSLFDKFSNFPVKIIRLESSVKFNVFKLNRQLGAVMRTNNVQILHSQCIKSLVLSRFYRHSIIKFHTIHIYPDSQYIAMKGNFVGKIMNLLTKSSIRNIHYPVACSESVKYAFKLNDNMNVACIPNGVTAMVKPALSKSELKKYLNLDPNIKYIISVGRFSKEKNFLFLIEQFMKLNLKSYKLIILGNGPLYDEVSCLIDDSIILTGFKQNVNEYLFASDYYISSSLTEGMPLSVLEAMSAGLPIILSDIEPHREIFEKAGNKDIGIIYNQNDGIDFGTKIHSVLQINYLHLKQNVTSIYKENFTAKKMSNEYQELYINAINRID